MGQSQPAMATYLQWKIGGQLFSQLLQMGEGSPGRQHAHHVQYEGSLGVTRNPLAMSPVTFVWLVDGLAES